VSAIVALHEKALQQGKELFLHTHFQNAQEITTITADCVRLLREKNITIRNQSTILPHAYAVQ